MMSAMQAYLQSNQWAPGTELLDKSYVYVSNEPQDASDMAEAAFNCYLNKEGAPFVKLAVSEEPKAGNYF